MSGPVWEVFAKSLRGLSGAKITKPGVFRNAANDGHSVRCSYKVSWVVAGGEGEGSSRAEGRGGLVVNSRGGGHTCHVHLPA